MADEKHKDEKSQRERDREADTTVSDVHVGEREVDTGTFEYGKPDEQGFIGVDPIYANYANDVDKPYNEDLNDDGTVKSDLQRQAEESEKEGRHSAKARSTRAATATTRGDREGVEDPGVKKD